MNLVLAGRTFLAGSFTYADIAFYLAQFFAARYMVPMTTDYPALLAWRRRVA
jgi:glutathione S-transferase